MIRPLLQLKMMIFPHRCLMRTVVSWNAIRSIYLWPCQHQQLDLNPLPSAYTLHIDWKYIGIIDTWWGTIMIRFLNMIFQFRCHIIGIVSWQNHRKRLVVCRVYYLRGFFQNHLKLQLFASLDQQRMWKIRLKMTSVDDFCSGFFRLKFDYNYESLSYILKVKNVMRLSIGVGLNHHSIKCQKYLVKKRRPLPSHHGAMTLSITTLSIMPFSITMNLTRHSA